MKKNSHVIEIAGFRQTPDRSHSPGQILYLHDFSLTNILDNLPQFHGFFFWNQQGQKTLLNYLRRNPPLAPDDYIVQTLINVEPISP